MKSLTIIKLLSLISVILVSTGCGGSNAGVNDELTLLESGNTVPTNSLAYKELENLPRITLDDFKYEGAFRIVQWTFNTDTSMSYSNGIFTIDPAANTIFVVGHENDDEIAEFLIPEIVNTVDINEVISTEKVVQKFTRVLNRVSNPQGLDRITGLFLYKGSLVVNAEQYYDGLADNTNTTLIIKDAYDIENSDVLGLYEIEGAVHAAGWMSEIPQLMQDLFKGKYLLGHASNYAINSRNPMGITAFLLDNDLNIDSSASTSISTMPLMDFDLTDFMYKKEADYNADWEVYGYNIYGHKEDAANPDRGYPDLDIDGNIKVNSNDLWTELSEAQYGFIVPGTRTYVVIGSSGGHQSGIGYKITQDNGNVCGGPCSYDSSDNYNYYWLFDIKDLIDVRNGDMKPNEPRPYEYGVFNTPFQTGSLKRIGGGYFDEETQSLYLSLRRAGQLGNYDKVPLFLKYSIKP